MALIAGLCTASMFQATRDCFRSYSLLYRPRRPPQGDCGISWGPARLTSKLSWPGLGRSTQYSLHH